MKKTVIAVALVVAPVLTFAGGAGNLSSYDLLKKAQSETSTSVSQSGNNTPARTGKSASKAKSYKGVQLKKDQIDGNGTVELEEYLGETKRNTYLPGQDITREADRMARAKNKALRLRALNK